MPGDPTALRFMGDTKFANGEIVRLAVVPAPDGAGGEAVVAAAWEDGDWVLKSEEAVSVISVLEAGPVPSDVRAAAGLPLEDEPAEA